ncbi:pyrroline-5-carboxylate reductase [Paenibacillus ihbetae]|uniref:Pyrroline-5-carboxylate reductase n=1 Tax=Paenibacillus ihbetae TaxID=1870820 RepID=A0A1B2DVN2_9BACL|nr:pyrroline-5-carboxylate reductase [Paenibacillus ihbetae]ANY71774.1 pyrroline-5-carboxylate reductase [Paenibacillus ihbetae]OOC60922.1 pyrroline-5-carboxylate reductase [Paenibacillus ihbetae]
MCQTPQNRPLIDSAITFYGAGSMAEAIVKGLITRHVIHPERITMLNRSNVQRLEELSQRYGVQFNSDADAKHQILKTSPVIVLAMKPKDAAKVLKELGTMLSPDQLIISVIAGLSIHTTQTLLGKNQPVARTMPNTSASIGLGSTGISFSKEISEEQRQLVLTLFEAVGQVTVIEEEKMDILTGISGSGPAYFYYMMEAMTAAGIRGGLSPEQSRDLTLQTILGAARMVQQTGEPPASLRAKITSPNGSTQAALETLDRGDFFETVIAAVNRCAERSKEMGAMLKEQAL